MDHFVGIDLHSNNSYIAIIDSNNNRIFKKKARNNLDSYIELLKTPFHGIRGEFPGASNNAIQINNKGPF